MRKAQIHMLETIAVLAIFFILVVLGFVFYTKVFKSGVEEEKEESRQLNAIEIAQRAATLPELQCSEDNVVKDNCIDLLKLEAAKAIINDNDNQIYYFDKFSFSRITVEEVYPGAFLADTITLYDRPLDDYSQKIHTNVPILIFDPVTDKKAFGMMNVTVFLK